MAKKPDLAPLAVIITLLLASSALAVMLVMSDEENRALGAELDESRRTLQATRAELYDKVELIRQNDALLAERASDISALSAGIEEKSGRIEELEQELGQAQSELQDARTSLQQAEQDIQALGEETLGMAERINQSIAWFTRNAELPGTLKMDRFIRKAENGCVRGDTLRLGCVSYLMTAELGFHYQLDPEGDTLYSIDEIIQRKGGDCEDYALFVKALLNRFSGMELEAWKPGTGRYELYKDHETRTIWYYDDANPERLDGRGLKPYAVCYYHGYHGEAKIGHCIIMVTGKEISSPADITLESLSDARFFEPQTGEYFGQMGVDFGVCSDGDAGCEHVFGNIVFIITDNDLFEFSGGRWNHYGGYLERAEGILEELGKIGA